MVFRCFGLVSCRGTGFVAVWGTHGTGFVAVWGTRGTGLIAESSAETGHCF